jgi:hypothetical protein
MDEAAGTVRTFLRVIVLHKHLKDLLEQKRITPERHAQVAAYHGTLLTWGNVAWKPFFRVLAAHAWFSRGMELLGDDLDRDFDRALTASSDSKANDKLRKYFAFMSVVEQVPMPGPTKRSQSAPPHRATAASSAVTATAAKALIQGESAPVGHGHADSC